MTIKLAKERDFWVENVKSRILAVCSLKRLISKIGASEEKILYFHRVNDILD